MKPFVEIQGSTALVQADSSFKVKIHFKPKYGMPFCCLKRAT